MASMDDPDTFALASLDAVRLFVEANGRAIFYDSVVITSIRVRDARDALMLLPAPRRQGAARLLPPSPPREDAPRPITVTNRARVDHLATVGFMLQPTDMILDDLLREVEARRVVQEHVDALRRNAQFIIHHVVRHDPAFFSFVDDVAKEMLGVADKLRPPCRNFAQLHHALQSLKRDVNALGDRNVVLSTPRSDLPARGPAVILATGAPSPAPAPATGPILPFGAPSPAPATGPAVEPLALDEEEAAEDEEEVAEDEEEAAASEKPLAEDEEEVAASEKTLALDEEEAAEDEEEVAEDEEEVAASEKTLAMDEEEEAASEKPLALDKKAAASEAPLALQEKAPALEENADADLADPEAHNASVATADAFRPGSTNGPVPDAA